ncbi:MAG: hypothetical protein R3D25_13515 [Geminicoccaceae bacterium]
MSIEPAFLPGLCSVTFRSIDAEQVIALAVEAGARGIEWCSTVHVPPGHLATAMRIAAQCRDAGLDLPSYGTYVRAGADDEQQDMGAALDTAAALGAPNVRVWAGRQGSELPGRPTGRGSPMPSVPMPRWRQPAASLFPSNITAPP